MYRLKIHLDKEQTLDALCFDILIKESKTEVEYEVLFDSHGKFEKMLKDLMEDTLYMTFLSPQRMNKEVSKVRTVKNLKQNLEIFKDFLVEWYHLGVEIQEVKEDIV